MAEKDRTTAIRVLVVDDEAEVRDSYRQVLQDAGPGQNVAALRELRSRLFNKNSGSANAASPARTTAFEPVFCDQAEAAVAAVQEALAQDRPFAVVFLDMRMPPGRDGAWAAARIRELDPAVEIVICTAYSDIDPGDIGKMAPPEEKLSYLQKPFHPHEVRQMTVALGSKWRAERKLVRLAYFDTLTGLSNREQSRNRLLGAIEAARKHDRTLAVLYLDLDNFKRVNDTLGHAVGDELLRVVANRLRQSMRHSGPAAGREPGAGSHGNRGQGDQAHDLTPRDPAPGDQAAEDQAQGDLARFGDLARLGGDEFMVMLPNVKSAGAAGLVAQQLIRALREPMQFGLNSLVITPSIGIAVYPQDGSDAESLLRNADLAMYFAKRKSPGTFAFYDVMMNATALRQFRIEDRLRGALERNEFSLCYQPQFDVHAGIISGMEALLRWTSGELGPVPAGEFIPVAEESGLILSIGEWVLREACQQARAWHAAGFLFGRVAVNVSGRQFALPEFPARVAAILRETGLDASMLELEITESVIMADEEWTERALVELKRLGVTLAIDDFGTGYSSFGRLRHFAVDRLKIDRSFVTRISDGTDDRAIAAAIIAMSRSLRMQVTAEGVESLPQLLFLQEQDCHEAQGYLLSKALSVQQAEELLRRAGNLGDSSSSQRLKRLIG